MGVFNVLVKEVTRSPVGVDRAMGLNVYNRGDHMVLRGSCGH